jgi:hypothetical protein
MPDSTANGAVSDRREAMIVPTQSRGFLKTLGDSYDGKARIEVDIPHCKVQFEGGYPTYVEIWIKLFLGVPQWIGDQTEHPYERGGVATYATEGDGKLSWDEACASVLRRALDNAYPGASSLLGKGDALMTANRVRIVLTGADDERLLFEF